MLRLGHPETAIKSWVSCQRLNKRGRTKNLLARFANSYGMKKQVCLELDDWRAFVSIQLARYLQSKNKHVFSTRAEGDMIVDLIRDHWNSMVISGALVGKSCPEKQALFSRTSIVFPTVLVPAYEGMPIIQVNFHTQRRMGWEDRCYCGSGLPFNQCCGRIPGSEEVLSGVF